MDKEKLLKKFIAKFVLGHIAFGSTIFIWLFSYEYGFIDFEQFYKYGLTIFCGCVILAIAYYVVFGKKEKKERLAIMPLIISIHDTTAKLKKHRIIFIVLYAVFFMAGFLFMDISVIFMLMFALAPVFNTLSSITGEKIKYIENKPEGLNF